jgi:ketosteroid isomerase-like protein
MRQTLIALLAILLLGSVLPSLAADSVESELLEIEEARRKAIKEHDEKTLNLIYADDFTAITGTAQVVNKQQLMAVFKNVDPAIAFTTDEIAVRVFSDAAVFTGRLTGRNAAGETVSASRFTHVFVKRDGRWQCVAGQATAIPR